MKQIVCPLCASSSHTIVSTVSDAIQPVTNVVCETCALVFTNPRMDEDELKDYYHSQFSEVRHDTDSVDAVRARMEKKKSLLKFDRAIAWLAPYIESQKNVLDVGSSYGYFLEALRRKVGVNVYGIEPSKTAGNFAESFFKIPVFHGTVEEYHQQSEPFNITFDLIIVHHVLEHLPDPILILRQLSSLLTEQGAVYVAVPDITRPCEPLDTFFQIPHIISFSPWTLKETAHKAGLKVIAFSCSLPKIGMHAVLAKKDDPREEVNNAIMQRGKNAQEIKNIVRRYRVFFNILRMVKKISLGFLPLSLRTTISGYVRKALRKIKAV